MTINSQSSAILEVFGEDMLQLDTKGQEVLAETFSKVTSMLQREDQGWVAVTGSGAFGYADAQFGLHLDDLKNWSLKIREAIIGAPWIGAGFRRRQHYVWEKGIRYGNIHSGGIKGKKNVQNLIDLPRNQFSFFSAQARRAREECLFADGIAFWIGNDSEKTLEAIPLRQITDQLLEPNGLGYAIAYKREWNEFDFKTGKSVSRSRWYFTDRFVDKRVAQLVPAENGGTPEEVDQKHVIFDQHANMSTGLVYGSPDAVAAFVWNGIARDAVMDGRAVMKSLATFSLKAKVKSPEAGSAAALKLASTQGAGNTAITGQANDLVPMASAGKGYDFTPLRFLVAIVAAALDISVIHLTANPGDAGSSYGSAQTLDLPTRLAMEARRSEHIELDKRVLRWMGVKEPDVHFKPYDAGEEVYRSLQALALSLDHDLYDRQEVRDLSDDLLGRPHGTVPDEDQRPSVLLAKIMAKIEAKKAPAAAPADSSTSDTPTASTTVPQTAGPAQGRSNKTGGVKGGSSSNDIRRDK
ncbi:MAG: hypothetical protein ACTH32_06740 [Microbacterium gubbeenense]|uniref:hypothetical protein n=1 Tax=Microbacterium gubbeenense TaxID=159896 RepID=UPI003F968516